MSGDADAIQHDVAAGNGNNARERFGQGKLAVAGNPGDAEDFTRRQFE